jgi:REP element-mobilizing transposase RayT
MTMKTQTKKQYLHQLISQKNEWSRSLTIAERKLGFLGWHERGYLPHCDFPNLIQFITFRLDDSMPASRRGEWEHLLKIEDARDRRTKLEQYLDRGVGACELRESRVAQPIENALLSFHHKRYEVLAWCIMPNHVHVLCDVMLTPLWKIIQSWKTYSTFQIRRLGLSAKSFWQREYWDTFMRNEDQERKAIKYIEANPVKAGLCRASKHWPFSSARYRNENGRLNIQEKATYVR